MITARNIILTTLIVVPILVYLVLGGYAMWELGRFSWFLWLAPICGLLAWVLSRLWPPAAGGRWGKPFSSPKHWTSRDQEAAEIVRAHQQTVERHTVAQLTDPHFYIGEIEQLATKLARHYHPKATDPVMSLTVPEVLAAVRLAVDDVERWMLSSVPGSRMLTIRHWQMLQSAPQWARHLQDAGWAAAILINPVNIARYFSSKLTYDPVTEELQTELLAVIYLRFIRQVGYYLIEMNSGRLRGGADAYRAAFGDGEPSQHSTKESPSPPITIALVGQVSSGKSSLVNLLTGDAQAATDLLPETQQVERFQFQLGEPPVEVTLLDTPGYGDTGASKDQVRQIRRALEESSTALLVMDAHSPAREADRVTLDELKASYVGRRHLKPPPVLGVLTHIDLLAPPLEWSPPYEWREASMPKEESIHSVVEYVSELFSGSLVDVVPLCSGPQKERVWGLVEELIPALTKSLPDAQAVALLRAYESQLDRDRWKLLVNQVGRFGRDAIQFWLKERLKPGRARK